MITVLTPGFDVLLDHWRLSEHCDADITLMVGQARQPTRDALVCGGSDDAAALYSFDNGARLFARVRRSTDVPVGHEVLMRLRDERGDIHALITRDVANNVIHVPFVFDEAVHGFEREQYAEGLGLGVPPWLLRAYYGLKRVIPRAAVRELRSLFARRTDYASRFPAWPMEDSLEHMRGLFVRLLMQLLGRESLQFIWFWPHASEYCLVLTHDVETASGRDMIERFIEIEGGMGLRSSYNVVPADYDTPDSLIARIWGSSCEVGVHGWTHDGLLFSDRDIFIERVEAMRAVAAKWKAVGFRSPATHRKYEWFSAMGFEYDSSAPDSDPFEPQAGGCLSIFPFFVDDVVEIPITMPQDHTLFALLRAQDWSMWDRKARAVIGRHGVVCMLAHPDEMAGYAGNPEVIPIYRDFLAHLCGRSQRVWNPLPCELSRWWRARREARLITRNGGAVIAEGDSAMAIGTLRLVGDELLVLPPDFPIEAERACAG
jgi:hypothetical protein